MKKMLLLAGAVLLPPCICPSPRTSAADMTRGTPHQARFIVIEAFKREKILRVFTDVRNVIGEFRICRLSGTYGPKERAGDLQVPEGFYRVVGGGRQSMRLDYPNREDRRLGRTGGGIAIHGGCWSSGCISLDDGEMMRLLAAIDSLHRGRKIPVYVKIAPSVDMSRFIGDHPNSNHLPFWKNLARRWCSYPPDAKRTGPQGDP